MATGRPSFEELEAAGPDGLVRDLTDTDAVMEILTGSVVVPP